MSTPPLPPELLKTIIDFAAQCDSTYDSHRERLCTLSSLSLVNQTFRDLAQPLMAEKVFLSCGKDVSSLVEGKLKGKIKSLTDYRSSLLSAPHSPELTQLFGQVSAWRNLEGDPNWKMLKYHQLMITPWTVISPATNDYFLSLSHLPSLRALALRKGSWWGYDRHRYETEHGLLSQLDCIIADQVEPIGAQLGGPQPSPTTSACPIPWLFDLPLDLAPQTWLRFLLSRSYVRVRLPCEPVPSCLEIGIALLSATMVLLDRTTTLKELYLDLYPRDGRKGYVLDEEAVERVEELQNVAMEKNVEIVWEDHEDDWCRSLVSREFWKRSKEKKKEDELDRG
ncbi:uncharacterized protein JCM6883_003717 [Sporobolomyces salmoneus]|uniref:uncharacterized protein n=1 Tax=Sporobolomyces salmoneus TaxID=183962 RepID=UPI003174885B